MVLSFNITETFDERNCVKMRGMPAKKMGRPNEERKVQELLNKLKGQRKAKRRPIENQGSRGPAIGGGDNSRRAV